MVWRDCWTDTPAVVILAEQDAQDGALYSAVLMLRDVVTSETVTVTDPSGRALRVQLPDPYQNAEPYMVGVGLDLTVESP